MTTPTTTSTPRIYEEEGGLLLRGDEMADRVILLPAGDPRESTDARTRIRIQWGQHLLSDLLDRRYRTLVCGVNREDNTHGIIAQLAELLPTSQWNTASITHHADTFARSIGQDDVLVLKYDLDAVEVLALLRPPGRDHFTLTDLEKGFKKVAEMLEGRRDRWPAASVSFLGAKSNRLVASDGQEPSFERVLKVMHESGYRGDVFPSLGMWELAPTGVFATYPFPAALDRMRDGGF
ncbi:MAG: hypothetical protein ACF8PN_07145 [Phycisphaerales bacterium]